MYALKWANARSAMFFAPDDGGGTASPAPASSSGDGSGGAVPSTPSDGDNGGGASPSSSPSPSPDSGAGASPSTPVPTNLWDSLGSADDLDHMEIPPTPAPVVPVAPVVPPVATPPATPVAAQPQVPQPPSPASPEPQPQAAAPLSPSNPVAIATAMEANRNDVVAHLASTKFALSPEDIQELETDVVAAVPKMMARAFFEAQVSMQKFLAQAVPGMMKQYNTVTKANDDAEGKFFESHKLLGLDRANDQHRATATRIASIYRQANPGIKLDQLIAEVGPMVAAAVKANVPAAPRAPTTPGQPRGGNAFRPAVNGGGGAPPTPVDESPWAGMGQTFD